MANDNDWDLPKIEQVNFQTEKVMNLAKIVNAITKGNNQFFTISKFFPDGKEFKAIISNPSNELIEALAEQLAIENGKLNKLVQGE